MTDFTGEAAGRAYAHGYRVTYDALVNESANVRQIVLNDLRRKKRNEPVGSATWHGYVGMITAASLLTGGK